MSITSKCEISVRFREVDSMEIVWHGHYIQYFEDGRESFGQEHGIGYIQAHKYGLTMPVVTIQCDYKRSLKYGDTAIVETTYVDCPEAKIQFDYKIYRASDRVLVATGKSTQVFLDKKGELQLFLPDFAREWKKKMHLL